MHKKPDVIMARKYRDPGIDLGLTALCQHSTGQILSFRDIADVCGCSPQMISRIEFNARKKLERNEYLQQIYNEVMLDE